MWRVTMPRNRCCDLTGCVQHYQNFRAGVEVGQAITGFEVEAGTWAYVEDPDDEAEVILKESGTTGALLVSETPIPDFAPNNVNMIALAGFVCATGIKPRIHVNLVHGPGLDTSYYYSEYDYDAQTLTINSAGGGVLASVSVPAPGEGSEAGWQMCMTRFGTLSVDFDNQRTYACVSPITNGKYAGIGNGGTTPIHWTGFSLSRHYWSDDTCPYCICTAAGKCVAKTLTVTLEDEGGCSGLDGVSFEISQYEIDGPTGEMKWAYDGGNSNYDCNGTPGHPCEWIWQLTCDFDPLDPDDLTGWIFYSDVTGAECDGDFLKYAASDSTSEPLNLIFRGIAIAEEPPASCCDEGGGSITAYITES